MQLRMDGIVLVTLWRIVWRGGIEEERSVLGDHCGSGERSHWLGLE